MEMEIVKQEKNEVEIKLDNVTVAEIMRVYLNQNGADFAVWRREHPTKPVNMIIKSSGKTVKKEVSDAVSAIKKDLDNFVKSVKK